MWRTSAYIDINAWKAGIATSPEDYRWSSFAAAVGGDRKARAAYSFMYGGGEWCAIRECHEKSLQEAMNEVLKARAPVSEEGVRERRGHTFLSKMDPQLDMPDKVGIGLAKGSEWRVQGRLGRSIAWHEILYQCYYINKLRPF